MKNETTTATENVTFSESAVVEVAEQENRSIEEEIFRDLFSSIVTVKKVKSKKAEWLVDGIIPKGAITVIGADGGVGKTSSWINLISALSSGNRSMFDPEGFQGRRKIKVAYLSSEDSTEYHLKERLDANGADQDNILTYDEEKSEILAKLKIGTPYFEKFVSFFKPELVVLDPLQGFLPPELNMGARNAMRDNFQKLISMGTRYGTTFLIICHANKRKGAYGRDRLADSADLWDAARSVLMAGYTDEDGIRYISHEKNNYGPLSDTILYRMTPDAKIDVVGTSHLKDKDYQQMKYFDTETTHRPGTKSARCTLDIIVKLNSTGGEMKVSELDRYLIEKGYTTSTIRRAKEKLEDNEKIERKPTGFGSEKEWIIRIVDRSDSDQPAEDETPCV